MGTVFIIFSERVLRCFKQFFEYSIKHFSSLAPAPGFADLCCTVAHRHADCPVDGAQAVLQNTWRNARHGFVFSRRLKFYGFTALVLRFSSFTFCLGMLSVTRWVGGGWGGGVI